MMRAFVCGLCGLLVAGAAPAAAQTASSPTMELTIFGGVQTGQGIWSLDRQPLCVLGPGGQCDGQYDTLRLSRAVTSSIVAGAAVTYFVSPHVGLYGHIGYQGFSLDDGCTGLFYHPDGENRNEQVCDDIRGAAISGGALSLIAGLTLRAAPAAGASPYVRAGAGLVSHGRSTVDVAGSYTSGGGVFRREIIADDEPHRTSLAAFVAAGVTMRLHPGYGFRLELRDIASSVDRPLTAADALGQSRTARRLVHSVGLTMGLDIVLEKKRGRRY